MIKKRISLTGRCASFLAVPAVAGHGRAAYSRDVAPHAVARATNSRWSTRDTGSEAAFGGWRGLLASIQFKKEQRKLSDQNRDALPARGGHSWSAVPRISSERLSGILHFPD